MMPIKNIADMRIGNNIMFTNGLHTTLQRVNELSAHYINGMSKESYRIIPLEVEWFKRYSFFPQEGGMYAREISTLSKGTTILVIQNYADHLKTPDDEKVKKQWLVSLLDEKSKVVHIRTIEFVHDLQNLWHSLTGEEIKQVY